MAESKQTRREVLDRAEANHRRHLAQGVYSVEDEAALVDLSDDRADWLQITIARLQARLAPTVFVPSSNNLKNAARRLPHMLRLTGWFLSGRAARSLAGVAEAASELVALTDRREQTARRELARQKDELHRLETDLLTRLARLEHRLNQDRPSPPAAVNLPVEAESQPVGLTEADYLDFENRFRGDSESLKHKQRPYVELFRSAPGPIVDLGCGRGEFLDLLAEAELVGWGVDLNQAMVDEAVARGHKAETADAVDYLGQQGDTSLGGLFLAQVIEHLPLPRLIELLAQARRVLAPGGIIIAETINPACLSTFGGAFYKDPTHLKPIHPQAAQWLMERAGFGPVKIEYVNTHAENDRLLTLPGDGADQRALNHNFERLNQLLFSAQDYAVVGHKP